MNKIELINKAIQKIFPNLEIINTKKLYQVWEETQLKRLLSCYEIDCVFDVGANYGQYATMLRDKVGYDGLIISFEPIPDAAKKLRELSKNDSLWFIEELALSHKNGEQTFNIMESGQFSSLSTPDHREIDIFVNMNKVKQEVKVKTETLQKAFNRLEKEYEFKKPFLKLDTQGFDVMVVKSGKDIIQNFIGLQSELAIKKLYEDSIDFRDAITTYEKHGFSLSAFVPNNAGHFPRLIETDCIMIRNDLQDVK